LPQAIRHVSIIPTPTIIVIKTTSNIQLTMPQKDLKTPKIHPTPVPPRLAAVEGIAIVLRRATQPPFPVDQRLVCGRPVPDVAGVVFGAGGGERVDETSLQGGVVTEPAVWSDQIRKQTR
jgi:hypothetical protein